MHNRIQLAAGALAIVLPLTLGTTMADPDATAPAGPPILLPFDGGTAWLNSAPLNVSDLQGKVVLVDFWEYTCINCLRTLPYLRAWYRRYAADGFVIIGVQTPEFAFSGDAANVRAAVKRLDITWPVVIDERTVIAQRYHMPGWPYELLFDQQGKLREARVGEGGYPETEAEIQRLLRLGHPGLQLPPPMALLPQDSYDKPGAMCYPQTLETYVGPWHGQVIANAPAFMARIGDTYFNADAAPYPDGKVYLQGYWHPSSSGQAMVFGGGHGYLGLRYHAIQVVAVLKPASAGTLDVDVTQDGKPVPAADAGKDIRYRPDGTSYIDVDEARAYDLLMNSTFGYHELRLVPHASGLEVYSFAFESCEIPKHASTHIFGLGWRKAPRLSKTSV
jgi:thiol-disulfide isomerase/thioredoxin